MRPAIAVLAAALMLSACAGRPTDYAPPVEVEAPPQKVPDGIVPLTVEQEKAAE
jgi:PBP1b-binding outer membrane lipoprotein LpoB